MDALMAALVAGALAQAGDRPAWLAAILADRYKSPGAVILAALVALLGAGAIAAAASRAVAGHLSTEAGRLFVAAALLLQGLGSLARVKAPDRLEGWRLGAVGTSFLGLFILAFADGLQFIVLALSARAELPWAAPLGAAIGSMAVIAPAAFTGERTWMRLPWTAIRRAAGTLFTVAGLWLGLSALRLV